MELQLTVPVRFNEPGKCQLCGAQLPFMNRLFKSGQLKRIHEDCYQKAVQERKEVVSEYRTALKIALLDGSISLDEDVPLVELRQKLQLSEPAVGQIRLLVYHDLYTEATVDRILDDGEDRLLSQVQQELKISDTEIQPQLAQLARLRFLQQIDKGELPTVVCDILLKKEEVAHWQCDAEFWEERVTGRRYVGGSHGASVRIVKGVYYHVGAHRGELVTDRDIIRVDQGKLVITNKRIVFNGFAKSFSVPFSKLINYVVYKDAIQLDKEGKAKPGYFKTQDPQLLATLISAIAQVS